jgi:hypothetical protein
VANLTIFHFGSSADDSLAGKTPAGRDEKGMQNVRFGSLADMTARSRHVRFTPDSGHEVVTGPMPPFGGIIKTSDDLWRIIAFIRSVNPSSLKPAKPPTPPQ